jgi:pimeloyl-ACP methyl ester carboxylesterase
MFLKPARELAKSDHSELVVLEGVGHVCSVEAPDRFNTAALEFLLRH